jgi:very-short-patch-repair endonuclease
MERRDGFRRARQMRRTLTPTEAGLWKQLKAWRADGFQFRRQAPFRGYWLDFVCFFRRVVVEVDGAHHETDPAQREHDEVRDGVLKREGFVTLRFSNFRVSHDMETVLAEVRDALTRPTLADAARRLPSPGGEGLSEG